MLAFLYLRLMVCCLSLPDTAPLSLSDAEKYKMLCSNSCSQWITERELLVGFALGYAHLS